MARSSGRSSFFVAAGILLSRIAGLIRQRIFAHYLGLGEYNDVLTASFRIPNLLQNLFGEGVLSASFIPVYARLLAKGEEQEAGKVAGAVLGLLTFLVSLIVLGGVVGTPVVVDLLAPGFEGHKRQLTITLVRILFPATALMVLSAWCLGVLNSHRKFFLSYAAPVVWNVTVIIGALWAGATQNRSDLVVWIAWSAVLGSALQVLVQLPSVVTVLKGFKLAVRTTTPEVRTVVRNFWPAFVSRGAAQISAYVDGVIASFLGQGPVAALGSAQLLYTLPVSLFGMAVSAAELPAMSSVQGSDDERHRLLRQRLEDGMHRIAFFIVPCSVAFILLGQVVAAAVFQTGQFTAENSRYVWAILAGSAVGLLASTLSRLTSSAFYALGDTRSPLRYALVRVLLTTVLGFTAALVGPYLLNLDQRWGAVGLTATAGFAGWVEFALLRRRLRGIIGAARFAPGYLVKLWGSALAAALLGYLARLAVAGNGPIVTAAATFGAYGIVYGALTLAMKVPAAQALYGSVRRRV